MQQETPKPHKRRVRYKGKYPKKFEEKYKELNPEKYQDMQELLFLGSERERWQMALAFSQLHQISCVGQ